MKTHFHLLAAIASAAIAAMACSAPTGPIAETDPASTPPLQPTFTHTVEAGTAEPALTLTEQPSLAPDPVESPSSPTPASTEPTFANVRFTEDPDFNAGREVFSRNIQEIWAIWDYANMREGLTIRRVWYQNGEVWIEKEEPWDLARYGESGTMRDVSIHDYTVGLPPGDYELRLFIDGVGQHLSSRKESAAFIVSDQILPYSDTRDVSPDGTRTLLRIGAHALRVEDERGITELAAVDLLQAADWFPDSRHVLYSSSEWEGEGTPYDQSEQEAFVIDVVTLETHRLTELEEHIHQYTLSPDGRTLAVWVGPGFHEPGVTLAFMRLDENYERAGLIFVKDFDGFPPGAEQDIFPYSALGQTDWRSASEYEAYLEEGQDVPGFQPGIYRLNLDSMQMEPVTSGP